MEELAGATAIDCRTAGRTVRDAEFEVIGPDEAEMIVEPSPSVAAKPVDPIVATDGAEDAHVTTVEMF